MPAAADPSIQSASARVDVAGDSVELMWAATTHGGLVRATNQDTFRVAPGVFLVCDGMGGHQGGERASVVAADLVLESWIQDSPADFGTVTSAVARANSAILEQAEGDSTLSGMGTTLVGLGVIEQAGHAVLLAVNVGDSRMYARASGEVHQVTHDHSVVQELLDAGRITPEESRSHADRHVVTRVLGSDPLPEPDVWLLAPTSGTRYLLCTDGIHGEVGVERVSAALALPDPVQAVAALAEAALESGGRDNLTAVVVDVGRVVESASSAVDDSTAPRPRASESGFPHGSGYGEPVLDDVPGAGSAPTGPGAGSDSAPLISEVPGA